MVLGTSLRQHQQPHQPHALARSPLYAQRIRLAGHRPQRLLPSHRVQCALLHRPQNWLLCRRDWRMRLRPPSSTRRSVMQPGLSVMQPGSERMRLSRACVIGCSACRRSCSCCSWSAAASVSGLPVALLGHHRGRRRARRTCLHVLVDTLLWMWGRRSPSQRRSPGGQLSARRPPACHLPAHPHSRCRPGCRCRCHAQSRHPRRLLRERAPWGVACNVWHPHQWLRLRLALLHPARRRRLCPLCRLRLRHVPLQRL
jgi:hypothetical protein